MSVELPPNSVEMPKSVDYINRYASDVAHANNYISTVMATSEIMENQFGLNSEQVTNVLHNWQQTGQYPTEDLFDKDADVARDLLKINLYKYVLGGMEMQSSLSDFRNETPLKPNVYTEWIGSTFSALSYDDDRHSIEICNPSAHATHGREPGCKLQYCPLSFVAVDVQQEIDRYYVESDELNAAMKFEMEMGGINYMVSESIRLDIKLRQMRLHKIASPTFTNQLHSLNVDAKDRMRRKYYAPK